MKKVLFSIILSSLAVVGCDDFLVEEPELTQSNELTLAKFDGLDKATLGAYSPLYSSSWYGANFILSSELMAGNAKNPTNTEFTSGRYTVPYTWSYNVSSTSPIWSYAYYVISAANNVIDNLEGKTTSDITQQDLDNLKAECLFLRALSHFDLVRTYAQPYSYAPNSLGVPVILHTISGNQPARNTVKEVYDQVVADLLEAETLIDVDYKRSGDDAVGAKVTDDKAVVSVHAIRALLSRVYLYMEQWQDAATYATKVINNEDGGTYSLWNANQVADVWTAATGTSEVIFEIFGATGSSYNGNWDDITWMTNPEGYADVASTADLRDMYEAGDVRGDLFVSHKDAPDHFWTLKYAGQGVNTPDINNIIVLRLSEMYLNRAEALYNGATISGATALSDLNAITSRRGASAISSPDANVIFNERRKELAFEGHIFCDYARTKRSLVRTDYDGATLKDISFPNYRWALPIPRSETDANPNMVQNENY